MDSAMNNTADNSSDDADKKVDAAQAADTTGTADTPSSMDKGQIGLIALVVLAVLASIIMLVTGSAGAQKIALLAALWAAVIGFFLVTYYRRKAEEKSEELRLREELHASEVKRLEAERKAERATSRATLGSGAGDADMELLQDIKKELKALREQLDELAGREYTYVPASLRAEARRIMELEEQTSFSQQSSGAPSPDAIAGRLGTQPRNDDANPLADLIRDKDADKATAKESGAETSTAEEKSAATTAAAAAEEPKDSKEKSKTKDKKSEKKAKKAEKKAEKKAQPASPASTFDTGSFQAVRWDAGGDDAVKKHDATTRDAAKDDTNATLETQVDGKPVTEADTAEETRRGRRRSDAHREGALTVADLLASMKKDK